MCLREAHKAAQGMCLIGRWENKHGTRCPGDVGDANHLATMQQGAGNLPRPCYSGSIPSKDDPELPSTTSAASRTSKANNWLLGPASSLTTSATQCLHERSDCFVLVVFPN
ncbi:hypothetical protein NW758_008510 [Fusarium oxysporum]|nr:hypothetical protein NW758_008510 [Fusarium oxysporum]KAJ4120727.1 hypothetical protein NW769_000578 [Fusarium oxysporum]